MAKLNLLNLTKVLCLVTAIFIALSAEFEGSEARRKGRKNRDGAKRKNRAARNRHRRRHSNDGESGGMSEEVEVPDMLELLRRDKARAPEPPRVARQDIREWTEAIVQINAMKDDSIVTQQARGKFGYHSTLRDIAGKLVHVKDPGIDSHFGCNPRIENEHHIPESRPWIALIKRGKCMFFNKIKLGELLNASAVVIYDDKKQTIQVMNTVGTNVVSLMISNQDGESLASLVDSGADVTMDIRVGKTHNTTRETPSPTQPASFNEPLVKTTGAGFSLGASPAQTALFCFLTLFVLFGLRDT